MPARLTAVVVSLLSIGDFQLIAQQPCASLAAVESQVPASSPSPVLTLRTTLRQVVHDVVVNDKNGHAVKGLKASDVQLTEDGAPQTLVNFSEQATEAEKQAAQQQTRHP